MINENKAAGIFTIAGIILGFFAYYIANPITNFVVMIVALFVLKGILSKTLQINEKLKWWLSSVVLYIAFWFIIWTMLFNFSIYGWLV